MELKELALEYRESGRKCGERAIALREELRQKRSRGMETIGLRRRIAILESMARDARATSKYLENYYRRPDKNGEKNKKNFLREGDGIPELEDICKAIRAAGKSGRQAYSRRTGQRTDAETEADGDDVLS